MNDSEVCASVKDVLINIISCAGEPFMPPEDVVQLFYQYLISVTISWIQKFEDASLTLKDILGVVRCQPRKLNRVINYFRILSGTSEVKFSEEDDIISDAPQMERAMNRLHQLCTSLNIVIPKDRPIPVPQSSPFLKGKKLRLIRIDHKISGMSIEEYLKFSRNRQTASFLTLTGAHRTFRQWVLYCRIHAATQSTNSHSTASTFPEKEDRVGLPLLAHLITDDILDLIDFVLYLRRKLGIELASPLTPIEIKQGIQQIKSISTSL